MRFGLFCSAQAESEGVSAKMGQGFQEYLDLNVEAEELGFHSTFLVEHHFSGWNQISATLILLSCLAMRTNSLRLGTGVLVLPWHNPVLLAEEAATLDLVSCGRLDFGVGKGYRHGEFSGFQIDRQEADERFHEAVELIRRSWLSRTRFSFEGRFWSFEDIVVEPPPAQVPHPPLWAAAGSEASVRRAAEQGFNLLLDQYASPSQICERIALYRYLVEARDGHFDPMTVAVARQLYVAKNRADAQAALERQASYTRRTVDVSRFPTRGGGSHVLAYADRTGGTEEHAIFGTPAEVRRQLEILREAGASYVLIQTPGQIDQLRRFATEVMPDFMTHTEHA